MPKAILGKKLGMTQIFSEKGEIIPVTAISAGPLPSSAGQDRSSRRL